MKTTHKDLCPELPDIWYENEVCAIMSITGDGKSVLGETLAILANKRRPHYAKCIDDHNSVRGILCRAGSTAPPYLKYKGDYLHMTEDTAKYIKGASGGLFIDFNSPLPKDAKIVGAALHEMIARDKNNSALVTVQRGRPKSRGYNAIIKGFGAQHVAYLVRVSGQLFRVTTNWGTDEAKCYYLEIVTDDGVKFVKKKESKTTLKIMNTKKDVCPSFPGIWIEGMVCAIVYESSAGETKMNDYTRDAADGALRDLSLSGSILAKTLSRLIEGEDDAVYISIPLQWAFYKNEWSGGRYVKNLQVPVKPGTIIDLEVLYNHLYIYGGRPVVIDGKILGVMSPDDIKKNIGKYLLQKAKDGGAPLVVIKKEDLHLLPFFCVSRVAYLRRKEKRAYSITTSFDTPDARTYNLHIEAEGGAHFVIDGKSNEAREDAALVDANSTDPMCNECSNVMEEKDAIAYLGMGESFFRALVKNKNIPFVRRKDGSLSFKKENMDIVQKEGLIGTAEAAKILHTSRYTATMLMSIGAIPIVNGNRKSGENYITTKKYVSEFKEKHGRIYTSAEVAQELGVPREKVSRERAAGHYPYQKEWMAGGKALFDEHDFSVIREIVQREESEEIGITDAAAITNTKKTVLKILASCNVVEHTGSGDETKFRRSYIVPKMKELGSFVTLGEAILLANMKAREFYEISKEKKFKYYSDGCVTIYYRKDVESLRAEQASHAEGHHRNEGDMVEKQLLCFPDMAGMAGRKSGIDMENTAPDPEESTSPSDNKEERSVATIEVKDSQEKAHKLLPYNETAKVLGVGRKGVAALASAGYLVAKKIDKRTFFTEESVNKFLPIAKGLIRTSDVCEAIGADESLVRALEYSGKIPSFIHTDNIILYRKKDVEKYCASGEKWEGLRKIARIFHKEPFDVLRVLNEKGVKPIRHNRLSVYEISEVSKCLKAAEENSSFCQQVERGCGRAEREILSPTYESTAHHASPAEILSRRLVECDKEYASIRESDTYALALGVLAGKENIEEAFLTSLSVFCDAGRDAEKSIKEAETACQSLKDLGHYDLPLGIVLVREAIEEAEKKVDSMRKSNNNLIEMTKRLQENGKQGNE